MNEVIKKDNTMLSKRNKIIELQEFLLKQDNENIISNNGNVVRSNRIPLKHTFADGIYIREMNMPEDSVVIGAIHKHLHAWFLMSGHITVATENTSEEYIAPYYMVAKSGVKRVIYAHKDSVFVNVHKNPNNIENLDQLEKDITALSYEEYKKYVNKN
jgi:hypothetical protein